MDILHEDKRMIFLNCDCLTLTIEKNGHHYPKYFSQFNEEEESLDLDLSSVYKYSRNSLHEKKKSDCDGIRKKKNKIDLKLIVFLARNIINCGLNGEHLGIITPLNSENRYLSARLEVLLKI